MHLHTAVVFHFSTSDDNVCQCSKLFVSQEQNNFRSCCPKGLRALTVIFSVRTARNLTTTPQGEKLRKKHRKFFFLVSRVSFRVIGVGLVRGREPDLGRAGGRRGFGEGHTPETQPP